MNSSNLIIVTDVQISEIAENLDCGYKSYYNFESKELTFIPDFESGFDDIPEEFVSEFDKIEGNKDDYFEFIKMDSNKSYRVMADFADEIKDFRLKDQLIYALSKPKPFRQFKFVIDNSGKYREQWFEYKNQRMIDWVKYQLNKHNNPPGFNEDISEISEEL